MDIIFLKENMFGWINNSLVFEKKINLNVFKKKKNLKCVLWIWVLVIKYVKIMIL